MLRFLALSSLKFSTLAISFFLLSLSKSYSQESFKLFQDSKKTFELLVPENWAGRKVGGAYEFFYHHSAEKKKIISLETYTSSEQLEELVNRIMNTLYSAKVLQKGYKTIHGKEWFTLKYSVKGVTYYRFTTIHDGRRYDLYYYSPTDVFESDIIVFERIGNSFKFQSFDVTNLNSNRKKEYSVENNLSLGSDDTMATKPSNKQKTGNNTVYTKKAISSTGVDADEFFSFHEGFAIIRKGESYAIINRSGKVVIPFNKYTFTNLDLGNEKIPTGFRNGSCAVRDIQSGLCGLIDTSGKILVPFEYIYIHPFDEEGFARGSDKSGGKFYIQKTGKKTIIPPVFFVKPQQGTLLSNSGGLEALFEGDPARRREGLSGLKYIGNFFNGISPGVNENGTYSYFDRFGKKVISQNFISAKPFFEGLACVANKNEFGEIRYGFIDLTGKIVIPLKFTNEPGRFSNGLAYVEPAQITEFRFGFIDKNGELVIKHKEYFPRKMESTPFFENGRILLTSSNSNGIYVMNTKGEIIVKEAQIDLNQENLYLKNYDALMMEYDGDPFNFSKGFQIFKRQIQGTNSYTIHFIDLNSGRVIISPFSIIGKQDPVSGYSLFFGNSEGKEQTGYINDKFEIVLFKQSASSIW